VRTWLYYTLLRGYLETKKPAFEEVWIHQHIVDEKGRKMSKSVGNIIDPQELLREFGAEAMRFWVATEGDLSKQDLPCSKEKIRGEAKTLTKLLNVSRFVMQFDKPSKAKPTPLDQLFIDYMEDLTAFADKEYGAYDFNRPSIKLRTLIWDTLASHYLELAKSRAYNQDKKFTKEESDAAKYTLHYLLERLLILAYPIIPQITSLIANEKGIDLHSQEFPKAAKVKFDETILNKLIEFNKAVWKSKQEKGISLREPLEGTKIPKELKDFEKDIKLCHNI
jgi:valyl-tRNA synthetase